MTSWRPAIALPSLPLKPEAIYDDAVRVLDTIGLECAQEHTARRLSDITGGIARGDGRIYFSPKVVDVHMQARRAQIAAQDDSEPPFSLGRCWACLNYCDPETLEVRPATSEEAALMVRLWDARGLSGVVPLLPGDVPPQLATLTAERIGLMNSRALGGTLTVMDAEEVRFLIDMNLAAGRVYKLEQQVSISPLRLNAKGMEIILAFKDNPDVRLKLGGSIPMAGATSPLAPRAAAAQAVAERLALDIVCAALDVEGPGLRIRIEPFDFRYSTIVFGSPEWCLLIAVALGMNEYLMGRTDRHGMFRSTAKGPDPQAASERMASVLFQALMGVRVFGAVGQLSIDEVFSPQQAVIDREILAYVARVVTGMELDWGDPLEMIRQGVGAGEFLTAADTVARFRDFYHRSDLFRHWNVGRWRSEGSPSILSEAWARAKEEMRLSMFQLEPDQCNAVERIYERAKQYILR